MAQRTIKRGYDTTVTTYRPRVERSCSEWHVRSRVTPWTHPTGHWDAESDFESGRVTAPTVNSPPPNPQPHRAVGTPLPPGGWQRLGVSVGVSVAVAAQNCYIVNSCSRRYSKGYRPKTPINLNAWGR